MDFRIFGLLFIIELGDKVKFILINNLIKIEEVGNYVVNVFFNIYIYGFYIFFRGCVDNVLYLIDFGEIFEYDI